MTLADPFRDGSPRCRSAPGTFEKMPPSRPPFKAVCVGKTTETRDTEVAGRVLRHWHAAVPNDRMAHLVKDATRGFLRALQARLAKHNVQMGHWTFLRILWEKDGVTKRELSVGG